MMMNALTDQAATAIIKMTRNGRALSVYEARERAVFIPASVPRHLHRRQSSPAVALAQRGP
jgi:hypothetical protein